MKKIIISLFSIMIITFFALTSIQDNKILQPSEDIYINQEPVSMNNAGFRQDIGNTIYNSTLKYSATDRSISSFYLKSSINGANFVDTDISLSIASSSNFRLISKTNNLISVSRENANGGNFAVWNASGTAEADVRHQLSLDNAFSVQGSTSYTLRVEIASTNTGRKSLSLQVRPGTTLNQTASLLNRTVSVNTTSSKVETSTFTTASGATHINLALRFLATNTGGQIYLRHVGLYKTVDYNLYDMIAKLYTDNAQTKLKTGNLADIQAQIDAIDTYLTTNSSTISNNVKTEANKHLERAKQLLASYQDIEDMLNSLYKDGTKTEIIDTLTQSQIDSAKAMIDEVTDPAYKNQFTQTLTDVQVKFEKKNSSLFLKNRADELTELINGLPFLNAQEKAMYLAQLNQTLELEQAKVDSKTTVETIKEQYEASFKVLNDVFLIAYQVDSKNEIDKIKDEIVTYINSLTDLTSAEKQDYIDRLTNIATSGKESLATKSSKDDVTSVRTQTITDLKAVQLEAAKKNAITKIDALVASLTNGVISTELQALITQEKNKINASTSPNDVRQLKETALFEINLKVEKEKAIDDMTAKKDAAIAYINQLTNLTQARKTELINEINAEFNTKLTEINDAREVKDVEKAAFDAKNFFEAKKLVAQKEDSKIVILNKKNQVETYIQNNADLTSTQKLELLETLTTNFNNINQAIDDATTTTLVKSNEVSGVMKLDEILLSAQKMEAINRIEAKLQAEINKINTSEEFAGLTPQEKASYIDKLNDLVDVAKDAINGATTKAIIDQIEASVNTDFAVQETLNKQLGESNLETSRSNYIDLITQYANARILDVNQLSGLSSDEKTNYIDQINALKDAAIAALNDSEIVDPRALQPIYKDYENQIMVVRNQAFIQNNKNLANVELKAVYDEVVLMTNNSSNLSQTEKDQYLSELQNIYDTAVTNINASTTSVQVTQQKQAGIDLLKAKELVIYRTNTKNLIDAYKGTFMTDLDNLTDLSQSKKNTFIQNVNDAYAAAIAKLPNDASFNQIDETFNTYLSELIKEYEDARTYEIVDRELYKEGKKTEINNAYNENLTKIDALENISEEEKNRFKQELLTIKNEALNLLDAARSIASIDSIVSDTNTDFDNKYLEAKKLDGKNFIQKHTETLLNGGSLTDDLYEKILELNKELNDATSAEEVDQKISEGLADFDTLFESVLEDKRNEVRAALEAYAKDKDNQEEKAIIDEYVAMVTTVNFADQARIDEIIANGKTALDNLYQSKVDAKKAELRTELETYADENRSDAVNQIIRDAVAKVTELNFEDEAAINVIENEAKEAILAQKKLEAKQALDDLKNESTTPEMEQMIEDAKDRIDEQTSPSDVDTVLVEEDTKIKNEALKEEVNAAKDELDAYKPDNRSPQIVDILDKAKEALDKATSKDEIDKIVEESKIAIEDQILVDVEVDKAKDALDNYKKEEQSDAVKAIIDKAKEDLDKATTTDEVARIESEAKALVDAQIILDEKQKAKDILDQFVGSNPNQKVADLVTRGKQMIDSKTTKAEILETLTTYLRMITNQMLEDKVGSSRTKGMQDLLNETKALVETKSTPEELQAIIDAFGPQVEAQKLADKKQAAKDELDKKLGNNPTDEAKDLVDKAKEKIDGATTTDEIDDIVTETTKKVEDIESANQTSDRSGIKIIILIESMIILALIGTITVIIRKRSRA